MQKEKRKQLVAEYQERERQMGVYRITNTKNGRMYIDGSSNMNGLWGKEQFVLNMGTHRNKELQQEWQEFGSDCFIFDVLELLKQEHKVTYDYRDVFHNETQDPGQMVRSYSKEVNKLRDDWIVKLQPYGEKGYHMEPSR